MTQKNQIPNGWEKTTLGEIAIFNYGKGLVAKNRKIGNIPVYGSSGITGYHNEALVNEKGIIVGRKGSVGTVYKSEIPFYPIDTVYYITEKDTKCDLNFLYILLGNIGLGDKNSDSAVPGLNRNFAYSIPILLPPLPEQKSISSILSSFDNKIELLKEENKTLEEIGQTIFKEWFGKYKISDELPEGWRVGKINDFGSIICGKTPSKNNIQYFGGKIPFIKIPDMHGQTFIIKTEDTLTELGGNSQRNKFIPKGSICVSCIATVGLVSITSQNSQTNQQINSIIPSNEIHTEYLYYHMQSMKDKFIAIGSGGSATLNINTSTFLNIEIIIPNSEILQQFNKITKPIMQKILNNLTQISSLSQTRNELLPKLMSGKVRMKNLTLKQKHIN